MVEVDSQRSHRCILLEKAKPCFGIVPTVSPYTGTWTQFSRVYLLNIRKTNTYTAGCRNHEWSYVLIKILSEYVI